MEEGQSERKGEDEGGRRRRRRRDVS